MLTETWFNSLNNPPSLPGDMQFLANCTDKRGGGVAIFVSNTDCYEQLPQFTMISNDYEALGLEGSSTRISVTYRSLRVIGIFSKKIVDDLLACESFKRFRLILCEDFTINLLAETDHLKELINLITACGFENVIKAPTRVTFKVQQFRVFS